MAYINKLQAELAAAKAEIAAMREAVAEFRGHLVSAKFQGEDADGSRRDWIAVRDVDARLVSILLSGEG